MTTRPSPTPITTLPSLLRRLAFHVDFEGTCPFRGPGHAPVNWHRCRKDGQGQAEGGLALGAPRRVALAHADALAHHEDEAKKAEVADDDEGKKDEEKAAAEEDKDEEEDDGKAEWDADDDEGKADQDRGLPRKRTSSAPPGTLQHFPRHSPSPSRHSPPSHEEEEHDADDVGEDVATEDMAEAADADAASDHDPGSDDCFRSD